MIFNKLIEESKKAYFVTENDNSTSDDSTKNETVYGKKTFSPKKSSRETYFDNSKSDSSGIELASIKWKLGELALQVLGSDKDLTTAMYDLSEKYKLDTVNEKEDAGLNKRSNDHQDYKDAEEVVGAKWEANQEKLIKMFSEFKKVVSQSIKKVGKEFENIDLDEDPNITPMFGNLSSDAEKVMKNPEHLQTLGDVERQMVSQEIDKYKEIESQISSKGDMQLLAQMGSDGQSIANVVKSMQLPLDDTQNPLHKIFSHSDEEVYDLLRKNIDNAWNYDTGKDQDKSGRVMRSFNENNFITKLFNRVISGSEKTSRMIDKLKSDAKKSNFANSVLGNRKQSKNSMMAKASNVEGGTNTTAYNKLVSDLDSLTNEEALPKDIIALFRPYVVQYGRPRLQKVISGISKYIKMKIARQQIKGGTVLLDDEDVASIKKIALLDDPNTPFLSNSVTLVEDEETFDTVAESIMSSIGSIDMDDLELDIREVFESIKKHKKYTKK